MVRRSLIGLVAIALALALAGWVAYAQGLGRRGAELASELGAQPGVAAPQEAEPTIPAGEKKDYVNIQSATAAWDNKTKVWHMGGVTITDSEYNLVVKADTVSYRETNKQAEGTGNLSISDPEHVATGDKLRADFNARLVVLEGDVKLIRTPKGPSPEEGAKETPETVKKRRTTLTCDTAEYYYGDKRAVAYMQGDGRVRAVQEDKVLTCRRLENDEKANVLTLSGDVEVVNKEGETARAESVVYDTEKDYMEAVKVHVESTRKAAAKRVGEEAKEEEEGKVSLTADKATYEGKSETWTADGNVSLRDEAKDTTLAADHLVHHTKDNTAEGSGNLKMTDPEHTATAGKMHADLDKKIIYLEDNVEIVRVPKPKEGSKEEDEIEKARQKKTTVICDNAEYRYGDKVIVAPSTGEGPVKAVQEDKTLTCKHLEYDEGKHLLTLTQVTIVTEEAETLEADRAVYNDEDETLTDVENLRIKTTRELLEKRGEEKKGSEGTPPPPPTGTPGSRSEGQ